MAKSLYYALKGVGTNEDTIIEIIAGCYNEELEKLKQAYTYGKYFFGFFLVSFS